MLKEAIEQIQALAVSAIKPVATVRDEYNHRSMVYPPSGEPFAVDDPPAKLNAIVATLESAAGLVARRLLDGFSVTVLSGFDGVRFVSGEYHEWEHSLWFSDVLSRAYRHAHMPPTAMTQRELIAFLREMMEGTGLERLIPAIRQVEFSRADNARGTIERGRDSLGKSVESAVSNVDTFPTKSVAVISKLIPATGLSYALEVTLNLEPQPIEQRFLVWFDADDMRNLDLTTSVMINDALAHRVNALLALASEEEVANAGEVVYLA